MTENEAMKFNRKNVSARLKDGTEFEAYVFGVLASADLDEPDAIVSFIDDKGHASGFFANDIESMTALEG